MVFALAFPVALVPVAISALQSFVSLRRRVVEIRDLQRLDDPLPILLPVPSQQILRDEVNDLIAMKNAFTSDPVYRAALEVRGLTDQFDAYLNKKDAVTGNDLDFERSQDMFWRFMGLYYQLKDQSDGTANSDFEVDEAGIDQFLVRSAAATGQPGSTKILRAVAETLVDFLGDNAGAFLSRSSNKMVLSTILREFAARTDLETDGSNRLLKVLMGSVAVAAAEHGSEISDHPAATLLFNSLGRIRDTHGEDFVARIVTHAGFTSVVSDWTANLAMDPYMVDLVADLRGLDDGTYDPEDPTSLPPEMQLVLGALTNTVKVIGDNIGSRDPLDREDRFREVFAAALTGLSKNSTALLRQELDGDQFMGSLLEAVIATIGRTDTIQNSDLIAPVFKDLLDGLSGVVADFGQDRTLSRAEEILQDLATRITSDGVKQTLSDLEPLVGPKGARLIVAEVFAAARAQGDPETAGDIERLHAIAELLMDEMPTVLAQGLDSSGALRLVGQIATQVLPDDTSDRALVVGALPHVIELVDALTTGQGRVSSATLEAIYQTLLTRFETDAVVWQVLSDADLTGSVFQAITFVLHDDTVPKRITTEIRVQITVKALGILSSHGLILGEFAAGSADPAQQLREVVEALLRQALSAALEQVGRRASGKDVPEIVSKILERALKKDPVSVLTELELGDALTEVIAGFR